METSTIKHGVTLNASPHEVYEALIDPAKHTAFSGAPAEINAKPGGKFSFYGGQLEGTTLELEKDRRIVQNWRSTNWPKGHYSRVTYELTPLAEGRATLLLLSHSEVPLQDAADINRGWHTYYWTKMAAYFREQTVAVVRRFMEEFKNKANLNIVDELFTPAFVLHLPGPEVPRGP